MEEKNVHRRLAHADRCLLHQHRVEQEHQMNIARFEQRRQEHLHAQVQQARGVDPKVAHSAGQAQLPHHHQ